MSTVSENIAAVAALSKVVEMRRFSIKGDYTKLVDNEVVRDVNAAAKQETGIDVLDPVTPLTFEDSEKYEHFLDKIVSQNIKQRPLHVTDLLVDFHSVSGQEVRGSAVNQPTSSQSTIAEIYTAISAAQASLESEPRPRKFLFERLRPAHEASSYPSIPPQDAGIEVVMKDFFEASTEKTPNAFVVLEIAGKAPDAAKPNTNPEEHSSDVNSK